MNAATLTFARSNGRPRRFAFDAVLLLTVAGILLLGLVMMTSASVTIADKQAQDPLYFLGRQLTGVGFGIVAAVFAMMVPDHRVGKAGHAAVAGGLHLLVAGADPRHRSRSERQPPLVARRGDELPGVRAGARAATYLSVELRGAPASGVEGRTPGLPQAARRVDGCGGVAVDGAGLRCGDRAGGNRSGRAVSRRREAASLLRAGRVGRGRHVGDRRDLGLSIEATHRVHGPVGRSVQLGLPADAIADRHRPRRTVRRRASARACRNCSICPKRTPTSCSPCWPKSWAWSA